MPSYVRCFQSLFWCGYGYFPQVLKGCISKIDSKGHMHHRKCIEVHFYCICLKMLMVQCAFSEVRKLMGQIWTTDLKDWHLCTMFCLYSPEVKRHLSSLKQYQEYLEKKNCFTCLVSLPISDCTFYHAFSFHNFISSRYILLQIEKLHTLL